MFKFRPIYALIFVIAMFGFIGIEKDVCAQSLFTRTGSSYTYDMTDSDMDSVCQSNFGPTYLLATWNQIVDFVQQFGLDEFYAQTGMISYRSNGWLRGFASPSRRYFAERHDGIVPDGWLVHDQIGNHDIDLGSWYNTRPILCYDSSIVIDDCNTGVVDREIEEGLTMRAQIEACKISADGNHGKFVSCIAEITNEWKKDGLIEGREKGAIQSCAAQLDTQ